MVTPTPSSWYVMPTSGFEFPELLEIRQMLEVVAESRQ
jgi:hypothetical protein